MSYRCINFCQLLFVFLLSCQSQLTSKCRSYQDFALLLTRWHRFSLHAMLHEYAQTYICICNIKRVYVINFLPFATFVLELCVFFFLVSFIQTRTLAHRCLYVCMCVSLYVYTASRMHFTEAHVPHNFLCSHSCAHTLTLTLFLLSPLFVALLVVYEYGKSLASVCAMPTVCAC